MGMERAPAITSRPEREILCRIYVCGVANVSIRKEGGTSYSLRRGIRLHWGTEF